MKPIHRFIALFVISTQITHAVLPNWSYDGGPDPQTPMGKELIDHVAAIPNMPKLSEQVMGDQKFRFRFGPVNWRMVQKPNTVKILFIGQDATHIAEAAGRTATAGFGGRAQDLAAYFGVNEGGAFMNTYAFTIYGQYGAFGTPYIFRKPTGDEVRFGNFVDNELWLITQDLESPIVQWRNGLIDWIIRNNKDSIKLIVTFGGAARDSMAAFIESKGGKVGARHEKIIDQIQIPETFLTSAGGNNEAPVLSTREGKDLYEQMFGRKIQYSKPEEMPLLQADIKARLSDYKPNMVFTKAGPYKNGLLHPAQLDGYELDQITIKGVKTRSLKGLKLADGSAVKDDVLVVELPHPTFLSNLTPPEASKAVAKNLKALEPYVNAGWEIPADEGMVNKFAQGEAYKYARKDIGTEFYDFGTPKSRMVSVSSASRMPGNNNVIIFGTRESPQYDKKKIIEMTKALPAEQFPEEELFIARPRTEKLRYVFDAGPGEKFARIMKENLDMKKIFQLKLGMTFEANGIDAYYVKSHPDHGDFGHYRGTFKSPKVVVLADPHGYDDLITSRALTGTRGQHLHRLMKDMGINDQYLVIKTIPFGMDQASLDDWKYLLSVTKNYRQNIFKELLAESTPDFIIADGPVAKDEIRSLVGDKIVPIVFMNRKSVSEDMLEAGTEIAKIPGFKGLTASGKMANIPRSHLSFYARVWEGTSGDRVINALDKWRGMAFAEAAPEWAYKQKSSGDNKADDGVILIEKLEDNNFPMPGEEIPKYLKRLNVDPSLSWYKSVLDQFFAA